jgi:hypothetical protein
MLYMLVMMSLELELHYVNTGVFSNILFQIDDDDTLLISRQQSLVHTMSDKPLSTVIILW